MKIRNTYFTLAALALSGLTVAPARAQNTLHAPSDLILTFQNPGGTTGSTQTITAALGSTTSFRDAAAGSFTLLNTTNLGSLGTTLVSTFGATWYEQATLWTGAIGFRGTSSTTSTLIDFDAGQTTYFTKVRGSVGTVGQADSTAPTTINNSGTGITGGMNQVKGRIEAAGTTAVFVEATSTSFIDENNPFTSPGVQSTAYTNIGSGVQSNFQAGSFGTFGAAGAVELALDLYRLQNRNDVSGQYGFGEATNVGFFLGTLTLNQAGAVGFSAAAVPEPTALGLLGIAALGLATKRFRKSNATR